MGEATYTFRIDEARSRAEFDEAAKATDRTAEELLRSLMEQYLAREQAEYDAWFIEEVDAGIAEADAGDVIPHEEVEAEAAAWRTEMRRKLAASNSRSRSGPPVRG
jgi:predicted transcriptional regulator